MYHYPICCWLVLLSPGQSYQENELITRSSMLLFSVEDRTTLDEDSVILQVIEAYCTSAKARHTVNSCKCAVWLRRPSWNGGLPRNARHSSPPPPSSTTAKMLFLCQSLFPLNELFESVAFRPNFYLFLVIPSLSLLPKIVPLRSAVWRGLSRATIPVRINNALYVCFIS